MRTRVLGSALLPPGALGLWLQVSRKGHLQEGTCGAVASRESKSQAESVPPTGLGQLCRGAGWGCSGSPRLHVGKHKSFPCPSRPAWLGAGVPPELLEHLWLARIPERSPGRRSTPQHRALFLWGGGAASGSQQDPEPPQGRLQHRGG